MLNIFQIATPSPPTKLSFRSIRRDSLTLEWEPPEDDGGAEITGYVIEKREPQKKRWTYVHKVQPTVRQFEVPGLTAGKQYLFRVLPMNRIGLGDPIQPDEPITISSPYSKSSLIT